ncbi:MAG TPA: HYR domain-containing protein, partial [Saprospiraceae bacterium]|nr:HYR domain-containing protein [Saprospiraceae bacterium]
MNTSLPKLNATSPQSRILPFLVCFMLIQLMGNAQTFVGSIINTAGNGAIPSTGTGGCTVVPQTTGGTIFNCTVAGLVNQVPASCLLNFTHTFDSDIDMFLKAPNGQILELSTDNGGGGDNFTNTNFVTGAPSITTGVPPFTGNFAPEGTLTADVCGVTTTPTVTALGNFTAAQNGIWQLLIFDDAGGDVGIMLGWSITFAVSVPPCILTAPANITVNASPGLCAANVTVNLPSASPQGCIDGVNTGIRYSVNGGTFTNVTLPATTVTINNLPVGTNTITWQTYLISNGVTVSTVTQTIVVIDTQPPVIHCPATIETTLGSGECYAFINFNVTATDNCPFAGPATQSQTHGSTGTTQNNFATITFGLRNDGTTPILITGVYANLGDFPGPAFNGVVQTRLLYGPIGGPGSTTGTADITAWTPTPTQAIMVNITQYFQTTLFQIPLANQFVLNPGQARGIAVQATNGNFMRYSNGNQTTTDGHVGIISNGHYAGGAVNVLGNTPRMFKGAVRYSEFLSQIPIVQTAGLPSGSAFPIGTTTNCFTATDYAGFTASCCFNVVVHEFPNPSFELACNDNVQVSLDQECSAIVTADMILEGGSYGCY